MFACVGRGHHLHHAYNVEADIFKKHFPGVPLFGMFGNGEIGHDYLPDYTKPDGNREFKNQPEMNEDGAVILDLDGMHLSYSSIFVVLSLSSAG